MKSFARRAWLPLLFLIGFLTVAIVVRGSAIADWTVINPDEAELMAQARAAVLSPVPFSTWTLGTTGPFWPLFLAALGSLGAPLTLAFAHLLSAIFTGLLGFVVWLLARRSLGTATASVIALLWFLPIALFYPAGGDVNLAALSTEYLPGFLVLAAALFPWRWLAERPWLFMIVGALDAIAVGAKYQVLPLAVGIVAVQVIMSVRGLRRWFVSLGFWVGGALVPAIVLAIAMLLSGTVSWSLLLQNVSFLGSYANGVSLASRLAASTVLVFHQPFVLAALLALIWLFFLSDRRARIARAVLVFVGLVAVYAGGKAFPHYLILLFVALGLALALPIKPGARLVPFRALELVGIGVAGAIVVTLVAAGFATGSVRVTTPAQLADSVSPNAVVRQSALDTVCPRDSRVLVWGWAPELYIYHSWRNTVPFMNALGIATDPTSRSEGRALVARAVKRSDCVVDAVGDPFFAFGPSTSLTRVYPGLTPTLAADYRVAPHALACDSCTVYVRR